MNQLSKKKSILTAFGMFALVIIMFVFIGGPIQMRFGMTGVLMTELILLAMAIGGTFLLKAPFKEVFPLKKPKLRQTFATIVLWAATYLFVLFSTITVGYFFPEQVGAVNTGLNEVFTTVPLWIRFLIVAVSPAICEEAVHRGFILHFLKPIQKKWLIVLIMGILFGLFHMDPVRFLGTAILGAIITYIALETENMFYPFLLHFINNSLSVFATKLTEGIDYSTVNTETTFSLLVVGTYLIMLCIAPWLLWLGITLLHPKRTEKAKGTGKKVLICVMFSVFCIFAGGALTTVGALQNSVFNIAEEQTVSTLSETPYTYEFDVEEDRNHMLTIVLNTQENHLAVEITDEAGNVVYETGGIKLTTNAPLELKKGHYTITVSVEEPIKSDEKATFSAMLQKM